MQRAYQLSEAAVQLTVNLLNSLEAGRPVPGAQGATVRHLLNRIESEVEPQQRPAMPEQRAPEVPIKKAKRAAAKVEPQPAAADPAP
jgi:hypothetical protein